MWVRTKISSLIDCAWCFFSCIKWLFQLTKHAWMFFLAMVMSMIFLIQVCFIFSTIAHPCLNSQMAHPKKYDCFFKITLTLVLCLVFRVMTAWPIWGGWLRNFHQVRQCLWPLWKEDSSEYWELRWTWFIFWPRVRREHQNKSLNLTFPAIC